MAVEGDLRTVVMADATITTQVGTRVYPGRLPPSPTYPAITYREVSGYNIRPTMTAGVGLTYGTFEYDIWASDYATLKTVKEALVKVLSGIKSGSILSSRVTLVLDLYDDELEMWRQLVNTQVLYAIS